MTSPTGTLRRDIRARPAARRRALSPRRALAAVLAVVAVCAAALAASSAATWSSFTDSATVQAQFETSFGIGLVSAAGTATQTGGSTATYSFRDTTRFVPGATARIPLQVFSNSPATRADITLAVSDAGTVQPALRYSATLTRNGATTTLFGNPDTPSASPVTAAKIPATVLTTLDARGSSPLADGAVWSGPSGSTATVTLIVSFVDDGSIDTSSMSSGDASLTMTLTGVAR